MKNRAVRSFQAVLLVLIGSFLIGAKAPHINYPLQRVVSLAPNITEMIYLLDEGDKLVGRTDACDHPEKVKSVESTGPFGNPDLEKLILLKPDLVIYFDVEDIDFQRKMENLGIPAVQFKIESFADLQHKLLQLGQLLGKKNKAKEIVERWEAQLRYMRADAKWKKKVRVYLELWRKPLITVGSGSYLHEMIELAGGQNIAGRMKVPYPKPPIEFVIGADPELIILGYNVTGNVRYSRPWQNVTAVKNDLIISDVDLDILLRPGPRIFEGLKFVKEKIDQARRTLGEEE